MIKLYMYFKNNCRFISLILILSLKIVHQNKVYINPINLTLTNNEVKTHNVTLNC